MASRRLGGGVVAANDELFAERENLIKAEEPTFSPFTFGPKGQVYDGWETRRRREPGHDWAVVRLGLPGVVHGVLVDTAFFAGNYPPEISVEGCAVDGYPAPGELAAAAWFPLVPRAAVRGDARNPFAVDRPRYATHVRLALHPDGGVARLRVHGEPVPDPRLLAATAVDLAALENGGEVVDCSNMFYSAPRNLISPGQARVMGEGWETARRRDDGNDHVEFRLAGAGTVRLAELDTTHFVGNAPGWARLRGRVGGPDGAAGGGADGWVELLPRLRLQPDTRHRLRVPHRAEVTHVRLDVYPDGGMARVRLWGELSAPGRERLVARWFDLLPDEVARRALTEAGVPDARAGELVGARPLAGSGLPEELGRLTDG